LALAVVRQRQCVISAAAAGSSAAAMFPLFKKVQRKVNLCTWCASSWSASAFLREVGLNESSTKEKEFISSKDPLEDTDHT
jgi:hypothetical protein